MNLFHDISNLGTLVIRQGFFYDFCMDEEDYNFWIPPSEYTDWDLDSDNTYDDDDFDD